jgi:CTP:molybdopterin cytidylyltransferase MocA
MRAAVETTSSPDEQSPVAAATPQSQTRGKGSGRPPAPIRVAAVVLAGGQADKEFRAATGVENRALAPLAGRPMVAWVLEALAAATAIERIVLVGAEGLKEAPGARQQLRGGGDLVETIERGVGACPGAGYVLLATADIPALTAEAIDAFVRAGLELAADFIYPIIPRAANEASFPGMRRTYLRLTEGVFTGGNLFLIRPDVLLRQRELIRRAYAARKRPFRLAMMVGWLTLWRLWRGRLSLADAEAAISRLLGCRARAVITDHAELGADVDHVADLAAMAAYLERRIQHRAGEERSDGRRAPGETRRADGNETADERR